MMGVQQVVRHTQLMHIVQTDERQRVQLPGACWETKMRPACGQAAPNPQGDMCIALVVQASNLQRDLLRLHQML